MDDLLSSPKDGRRMRLNAAKYTGHPLKCHKPASRLTDSGVQMKRPRAPATRRRGPLCRGPDQAVRARFTRLFISGILKWLKFRGLAPWLAIPATSVAVSELRGLP